MGSSDELLLMNTDVRRIRGACWKADDSRQDHMATTNNNSDNSSCILLPHMEWDLSMGGSLRSAEGQQLV